MPYQKIKIAVIETFHGLFNHAAKKGVSEVPIKSIKPAYLRLSRLLDSVEMNLKGILHASACIAG
jgi:hypothetical protein